MAVAIPFIMVGLAALSAVQGMQAGKAAAAASRAQADQQNAAAASAQQIGEYNAELALREGDQAREQAAYEEARSRERYDKLKASQRAAAGGAGLQLEGTPLLFVEETAENDELDALAIRHSGNLAQVNAEANAARARFGAQAESIAAINRGYALSVQSQTQAIGANRSLLGGATSAYDVYRGRSTTSAGAGVAGSSSGGFGNAYGQGT